MNFRPLKGTIALDIDGTVVSNAHKIDSLVIDALSRLAKEGWAFIFITGRTFQTAIRALKDIPFPYALAVQNGALLLEMPSRTILQRKSISRESLAEVEKIGNEFEAGFAVYSGFESHDRVFYCPHSLAPSILSYGLQRADFLNEHWEPLDSFSDLPVPSFSSIKFFLNDERAFLISRRIEAELKFHAPPNRDPFNFNFFVLQVTHELATKGEVLREFVKLAERVGPIIAAGDDHNDLSMLNAAHIKVVMAGAPQDLLAVADVIAPPAAALGIIQGLDEAIASYREVI